MLYFPQILIATITHLLPSTEASSYEQDKRVNIFHFFLMCQFNLKGVWHSIVIEFKLCLKVGMRLFKCNTA